MTSNHVDSETEQSEPALGKVKQSYNKLSTRHKVAAGLFIAFTATASISSIILTSAVMYRLDTDTDGTWVTFHRWGKRSCRRSEPIDGTEGTIATVQNMDENSNLGGAFICLITNDVNGGSQLRASSRRPDLKRAEFNLAGISDAFEDVDYYSELGCILCKIRANDVSTFYGISDCSLISNNWENIYSGYVVAGIPGHTPLCLDPSGKPIKMGFDSESRYNTFIPVGNTTAVPCVVCSLILQA